VFKTFITLPYQGMYALRGPVIGCVALMILQEWMKGKEIEIKKSIETSKSRRAAKGLGQQEGSRMRQNKLTEVAPPVISDVPKKSALIFNEESDTDLISRLERLDKELSEIRGKLMSRKAVENCENEVLSIDKSLLIEKSEKEIDATVIMPIDIVNALNSEDAKSTFMQSMFLFYKKLDSLAVSDLWENLKEFAYYLSSLQFSDILHAGSSMLISLYSFDYLGYISISVMQFMGRSKEGIIDGKEGKTSINTNTHTLIPFPKDPSPSLTSPSIISSALLLPVTDSDLISVTNTDEKKENSTSENFKNEIISTQENESENANNNINLNNRMYMKMNNENSVDRRPQSQSQSDANKHCSSMQSKEKEEEQEEREEGKKKWMENGDILYEHEKR
jgi:hypothetical protein